MTRDRGVQRPPLSPLRTSNHGRGTAPADAVGSSSKDRTWQWRMGPTAGPIRGSRLQPQSDKKKSKKVEGTVLEAGSGVAEAATAPPLSSALAICNTGIARVTGAAASTPATGGSRIPRPPALEAAASVARSSAASPQPDLLAMLATPAAAPLLEELHQGSSGASWDVGTQQQLAWDKGPASDAAEGGPADAAPSGFHAYSNPSFDGVQPQGVAATAAPPAASVAPPAAATTPATQGAASTDDRVFNNGLAMGEDGAVAGASGPTPGLLDPAALTPNTERSLEAWLRSSPASSAGGTAARPLPCPGLRSIGSGISASQSAASSGSRSGARSGGAGSAGGSKALLPTPDAWHVLQHINEDSPPAAAPQGVRGIMNAYLRTGPQMLSPEPSGVDVIRAPDAMAVPASGLLGVAGPGGAGVLGMMNAYLRTGATTLSPEPGMEGPQRRAGADAGPQHQNHPSAAPLHPYSPVSPLAQTPAGPRAAAAATAALAEAALARARTGLSPSSVCSNDDVAISGNGWPQGSISLGDRGSRDSLDGDSPTAASVPRLNLAALERQQHDTDATEVSFGAALAGLAGSPEHGELPTARFLPACCSTEGDEQWEADATSPMFSFGMGGGVAAALGADSPAADAQDQEPPPPISSAEADAAAMHPDAAAAEGDGAAGADDGEAVPPASHRTDACIPRIDSGETVQQPNPFKAMLLHLRGPQYASPARFVVPHLQDARPNSPQSPKECTPLHLISTSEARSPGAAPTAAATPAPGQGSLTVWMDRRGMRGALSSAARNDLRLLWAAAHDVVVFKSEAAALRADNAALLEELEATQTALHELGAEHEAAVVAAEAGALCAEAEVTRARDAAGHMMQLADQIQGMFALCENEKETLVGELEAAQEQLGRSEAAAANTANLSAQQRAQLEAQLEDARQAVTAAQQAANRAQQRAEDAAAELEAIRRQLAEAQAQLAEAQSAKATEAAAAAEAMAASEAAAEAAAAAAAAARPPDLTPITRLRSQLGNVHDSLAHLHAEHCAGRLQAAHPELDEVLEASRNQLAHIEALLGGDTAALRQENNRLQRCLSQARSLLAQSSPAPGSAAAGLLGTSAHVFSDGDERRSPVPFMLFGRFGSSEGGEGGVADSPATCSDVFSSPYLASQATLTVDYRDLHSSLHHAASAAAADTATSRGSPAVSSGSLAGVDPPPGHGSPGSIDGSSPAVAAEQSEAELLGSTGAAWAQGGGGDCQVAAEDAAGQELLTVVHNGMIITHVPASEVSKVQAMVQYWEAVASGTPLPAHLTAEDEVAAAAAAEAYATAAIAAAEAALAARAAQEVTAAAAQAQEAAQEGVPPAVQEPADLAAEDAVAVAVLGVQAQQQAVLHEQQVSEAEAGIADGGELVTAPQVGQLGTLEVEQLLPEEDDGAELHPASVDAVESSPAATPSRFTGQLPAGETVTPCSSAFSQPTAPDEASASAAGTPARFTPLNFVAAPPPTPADGMGADPQQAQQLYQLALGMAATTAAGESAATTPVSTAAAMAGIAASTAGTPASVQRTASRLPATPAGTPVSGAVAALTVTPLTLSVLRARLKGGASGVQDAVRSRLARLKADLQAAQAKLATVDQGLAAIAFTPTSSITASGTPGSSAGSLLRRTPLTTPSTTGASGALGSPISETSASSPLQQQSFGSSSRAAAMIAAAASSPSVPVGTSPAAVSQEPRREGAVEPVLQEQHNIAPVAAAAAAATAAAMAAPAAECTPLVTRRSVRFADSVHMGSNTRGALRVSTPYSAAATAELDDAAVGDAAGPSPMVGSSRRSPLGQSAATSAASPIAMHLQRNALAAMQSAAKPAAPGRASSWRFALDPKQQQQQQVDGSSSSSDSGDEQDGSAQFVFDASRMAQDANRQATPSPPLRHTSTPAGTPMAHPERSPQGGRRSYVDETAAAAAATPATSMLSTCSFSPPEPLVLLAVRPLGRARRGGLMRGGRPHSETEEREFRRRAAALNIQISPYFRRRQA